MEVESNFKPEASRHLKTEICSEGAYAVWDSNALNGQVGKNAALQARLLTKFLYGSAQQVAELTAVAMAGQPLKVAQIAHQLKSSSRSVGAMQLGEACQLAETAGNAGQVEDCKALAAVIGERYAVVSKVIQASLV